MIFVILASGMGKRLNLGQPKCLAKVNGKSLIDYLIDNSLKFKKVIIVTG